MAFNKTIWVPDAPPAITGQQLNRIEQGIADAHAGLAAVPLVAALPANAADGAEVDLLVDAAGAYGGPVVWRMRNRLTNPDGTANSDNRPWVFVGGPWLTNETSNDEQIAAATLTYQALPSGPNVTAPHRGTYEFEIACRFYGWNVAQTLSMGLSGGVGGIDAFRDLAAEGVAAGSGHRSRGGRIATNPVGQPSAVLTPQYKHDNNGAAGNFAYRRVSIRPVKLGAG